MADKEKREVIQSYLITAAKYDFTADEKRVFLHLIEMMQPLIEGKKLKGKVEQDLWGTYHFTLPISFFVDNEDTKHERIKAALRALNEKKFEYEDENEWQIIRLIEMPKLDKRGEVQFYLSDKLVECFLNFNKGFTKFELDVSLSFRSVYSMRMYELICGQRHAITYSISKLKEMWDVTEPAYNKNFNFIERIIKQAKKELDAKANWSFDYKPIKKGRTFVALEFTPIHYTERESEEVTRAEAVRMVNLSFFFERELKRYLTNTCGFSARELKNNADTIKAFGTLYGEMAREKITEIWGRARSARNPKAYLIGTLKIEVENN